jgi:hypothetical protein
VFGARRALATLTQKRHKIKALGRPTVALADAAAAK